MTCSFPRALAATALVALAGAAPALADAMTQNKTQIQFSGFVGKMYNMFGGKSAKEGVIHTVYVHGDRMMNRSDTHGELVDLGEEKVYDINFDKQRYTVKTFDQIRKEWQEQQERAKKEQQKETGKAEEKPPEYEVDFDIKETGNRQKIGDFDTHEVVMTLTVRQKGKKLEEGGGALMTGDFWIGPKLREPAEIADFHIRYMKKLGIFDPSSAESRQAMAALMANPALAEAMKKFQEHRTALTGTPIRTTLTLDTVANPQQKAEAAKGDEGEESTPTSVGGLFGKLGSKLAKKHQEEKAAQNGGRTTVFTSQDDLLKVGQQVGEGDVAVPAGFKLKD